MNTQSTSRFRRHPKLTLIATNAALFIALAAVSEVVLRMAVPYNPGFYVSVRATDTDLVYPYGTIKINSDGYPDEEFGQKTRPRVAYIGDSVTYGVGAGYGYRVSEILEEAYPQYEHLSFGGIGLWLGESEIGYVQRLCEEFEIDLAIYLFNLNDIAPDEVASGDVTTVAGDLRVLVNDSLDWFRGRLYVYTVLRRIIRNALAARGIGFHGYPSYELFPSEYDDVIAQTAARVKRLDAVLGQAGTDLAVVYLPYEMQISREAESKYAEFGIEWDESFIGGSTQQALNGHLGPEVRRYDAYAGFVSNGRSRASNGLGEYFVYNRGDKLDWNHPNRAGHRVIAEYLIASDLFPTNDPLGP